MVLLDTALHLLSACETRFGLRRSVRHLINCVADLNVVKGGVSRDVPMFSVGFGVPFQNPS